LLTKNGAPQLVYKCLTYRVWEDASIISRVAQVLWTCNTEHLLRVKSASDQVAYSMSMAQRWMKCGELRGLAQLLSGGLAVFFLSGALMKVKQTKRPCHMLFI